MGKYIIELKRGETAYKTVDSNGTPLIQPLAPTPYTELDLERVRLEAEQLGMVLAWEAARKIWEYDTTTLREIFGEGIMRMDYFMKFTAAEVIEKLKAYDDSNQEIKVGDVVYHVECPNIKLWVVDVDHNKIAGIALKDVDGSCDKGDLFKEQPIINYAKTGQHFELATILEKMREGQDE